MIIEIGNLKVIGTREQSSMASTWDEHLCIERFSKDEFGLSIRGYEILGEIFEFSDEEGNLNLPDEIEGSCVVGSWEEYVIGGNLIPRDEYGEVRFTDPQYKNVSDWLESVNWDINDIREEIMKLSKMDL